MKVPKKVRILAKDFQVHVLEDGILGGSDLGGVNNVRCQIQLSAAQDSQQMRDTLIHEIIHAVDYAVAAGLEERQVHAIASGMYAVIRDNERLIEYLTGSDDG